MEANDFSIAASRALEARDRIATMAAQGIDERKMADLGSTALFEEALLSALHAHLAELKMVTR